jgi:hypothetical protein
MKTPSIKDVRDIILWLKLNYKDAFGEEGIDLTIGWNKETGDWGWQSGDNSYMGEAYFYPIWVVVTISKRTNSTELARDLINQLKEL